MVGGITATESLRRGRGMFSTISKMGFLARWRSRILDGRRAPGMASRRQIMWGRRKSRVSAVGVVLVEDRDDATDIVRVVLGLAAPRALGVGW